MSQRARFLHVTPGHEREAALEAARVLASGELCVIPTETVYGVAADPRVAGAEERIYASKEREPAKPIAFLAASLDDIVRYGAMLDERERKLAHAFWPGPLTLVLRIANTMPEKTEGFRVPDCELALMVLRAAGSILRVSSANCSGEPPALTAEAAEAALGDQVALVLNGGKTSGGMASTVVRVEHGAVHILREGPIDEEAILAAVV